MDLIRGSSSPKSQIPTSHVLAPLTELKIEEIDLLLANIFGRQEWAMGRTISRAGFFPRGLHGHRRHITGCRSVNVRRRGTALGEV
jgi:hypothetical protein